MNRRDLLKILGSLPLLGPLLPKPEPAPYDGELVCITGNCKLTIHHVEPPRTLAYKMHVVNHVPVLDRIIDGRVVERKMLDQPDFHCGCEECRATTSR